MNPKIKFFLLLADYAGRGGKSNESDLDKILSKYKLLWPTDSEARREFAELFEMEGLLRAIRSFNAPRSKTDDAVGDLACDGIDRILWWMFKELSVVKNPLAMIVFQQVAKALSSTYEEGDHLMVFAKSVNKRQDGSGTIVLHVSDLDMFVHLLHRSDLPDKDLPMFRDETESSIRCGIDILY